MEGEILIHHLLHANHMFVDFFLVFVFPFYYLKTTSRYLSNITMVFYNNCFLLQNKLLSPCFMTVENISYFSIFKQLNNFFLQQWFSSPK